MPRQAICVVLFVLILLGFLAVGIASMCQLVSRAYAAEPFFRLDPDLQQLLFPTKSTKSCPTPPMEGSSECAQPSPLLHPEFTPEYCADAIAANWALAFYAGDVDTGTNHRFGLDTAALNYMITKVQHDCKISEHKAARAVGAAIGELCGKMWPCVRDDVKLGDGT